MNLIELELNEETNKYKCPHCDKEYSKYGIKNHIEQSHNGKKNGMSGKKAWNKGLTKETDDRVKQAADTLNEGFESGRIIPVQTGKPISQETKDKISKSRIKYLKANPDKVPYVLNHYSKGESYPEKYFREVLENNNILFEQEKRESIYSLDFVIGNINLEIDGEQHYVDNRIVESDIKRQKYLEDLGYETVRIRWSHYQKLAREEKEEFIKNLIKNIED